MLINFASKITVVSQITNSVRNYGVCIFLLFTKAVTLDVSIHERNTKNCFMKMFSQNAVKLLTIIVIMKMMCYYKIEIGHTILPYSVA